MEQKNIIITILVIGLVITAVIVALNPKSIGVTGGQKENTISVTGTGKVTTQPDKAEIMVSVNTEGSTATAAKDANSKIEDEVITALIKEGMVRSDIETSYYYLNKKQVWEDNKMVDKGYEVNHILKVTTKNLDKVGNIVDAAVNAGATGVDSVSFGLTDEKQKETSKQALELASKEAGSKAEGIASGLGVKLGKLLTVSESNYNYIPFVRDVMYEKAAGTPAPEILPQTLEVTGTVSLVYEIG